MVLKIYFNRDTVTNGLTLRLFLEAILLYKKSQHSLRKKKKTPQLLVEVFISDFHAARVKLAFEWVLGLTPSLLDQVDLRVFSVDSVGIKWNSQAEFSDRLRHEEEGLSQFRENQKSVTTIQQLQAFLLLGGHIGLHNYLHSSYTKSKGLGW